LIILNILTSNKRRVEMMGWLFNIMNIMTRRRYKKARSFDRFIQMILDEGCQSVYATVTMRADFPALVLDGALIGDFTHSVRLIGTLSRSGKKVIYEEACQKWYGSSGSSLYVDVRAFAALETLIAAEKKIKVFERTLILSDIYLQFSASDQAIADIERYLRIHGNTADIRVVASYRYLKSKYPLTL
jgi:hypothetical protein